MFQKKTLKIDFSSKKSSLNVQIILNDQPAVVSTGYKVALKSPIKKLVKALLKVDLTMVSKNNF